MNRFHHRHLVFFVLFLIFTGCGKRNPSAPPLEISKSAFLGEKGSGLHHLTGSPDGSRLLGTTPDGTIRVWSADDLREIGSIPIGSESPLGIACTDEKRWLAATPKGLFRWDTKKGLEPARPADDTPIRVAAIAPSGRASLEIRDPAQGILFRDAQGKERKVAAPQGGEPIAAAFSPCGQWVALALRSEKGIQVTLFDTETFQPVRDFPVQSETIRRLVYSRGGTIIATVGENHRVDLWDSQSGYPRGHLLAVHEDIGEIAFSADTRLVAVSSTRPHTAPSGLAAWFSRGGTISQVQVFDVHSGTELARSPEQTATITGLLFTMDGTGLYTAAADGALSLWKMAQTSA